MTLKGEDIYMAGKEYGLIPAVGERYARECGCWVPWPLLKAADIFTYI